MAPMEVHDASYILATNFGGFNAVSTFDLAENLLID